MLQINNDELTVDILDPETDSDRFTTRYCTGGYIFQITDCRLGPLMSGPTYPDSFNSFDGQGIPDGFNLSPLRTAESEDVLIPGIGVCNLQKNRISNLCRWRIVAGRSNELSFTTTHSFGEWSMSLCRSVIISHRTVRSVTTIVNTGGSYFPIRWYPHPFYPHQAPGCDELIRINAKVWLPENSSYTLAASGFISRLNWPWQKGYNQPLDHDCSVPLTVLQRHPQLGLVSAQCSYIPCFFLIWGNGNTFSWEPYLERTVGPAQTLDWWIDYTF